MIDEYWTINQLWVSNHLVKKITQMCLVFKTMISVDLFGDEVKGIGAIFYDFEIQVVFSALIIHHAYAQHVCFGFDTERYFLRSCKVIVNEELMPTRVFLSSYFRLM